MQLDSLEENLELPAFACIRCVSCLVILKKHFRVVLTSIYSRHCAIVYNIPAAKASALFTQFALCVCVCVCVCVVCVRVCGTDTYCCTQPCVTCIQMQTHNRYELPCDILSLHVSMCPWRSLLWMTQRATLHCVKSPVLTSLSPSRSLSLSLSLSLTLCLSSHHSTRS